MSDPSPVGDLAGKRILVTGGSGFIGRQVVASLTALGARVRVLDLVAHPDPAQDIVIGNICDPDAVVEALDGGPFHGIVHLAAITSVLKSVEQPELTYETNVAGLHRVLEGARAGGVPALVFASTNAVTGPMDAPRITEGQRLRPLTPYGATKAAGEMMMSAYTAVFGVRCTALRLTNVYGPGMQAKDSIVARLMRTILEGRDFEVYGDGTQVRDYLHSLDVVAGVVAALTDQRWSGAVILGSGTSISVLDVVAQVRSVSGSEFQVGHGPAKVGEMPAVIVDNSHARSLGWEPRYDFATGVSQVWDEWRAAYA